MNAGEVIRMTQLNIEYSCIFKNGNCCVDARSTIKQMRLNKLEYCTLKIMRKQMWYYSHFGRQPVQLFDCSFVAFTEDHTYDAISAL